jgi:flagellar biosynthesis/type III secretory pathway protein FliH
MKNQECVFNIDFSVKDVQTASQKDEIQLHIEENLKNAKAESYAAGFARGLEEGMVRGELGALTKNQKNSESAFIKIYGDVNALLKQEYIYDQALTETVLNLATTIIKKVLPQYANKYGVDEMEHAVRYILSTLLDHQDVSIFLTTSTREDIYERIADIQTCIPNKVTLQTDDALKEWECRIEWKGGGARWSQPDLLDNIEGLFTQFIQSVNLDKEVSK